MILNLSKKAVQEFITVKYGHSGMLTRGINCCFLVAQLEITEDMHGWGRPEAHAGLPTSTDKLETLQSC